MQPPHLIHDAAHPQRRNPLNVVFPELVKSSQSIEIAVGYICADSIRYLKAISLANPALHIEVTSGMQAAEGLTAEQFERALNLHQHLSLTGRGGVFLTQKIRYHGKIYIFRGEGGTRAYIGSGNLSAIVGNHADVWEAGVLLDSDTDAIEQHLKKDLASFKVPLDKADVRIITSKESRMRDVDEATPVPVSTIARIFQSPSQFEFEIPLKTSKRSSLNAFMGGDGSRRQKTGHGLSRDWFEGELIVDKCFTSQPGYPVGGKPFTVVTHDGWSFECKTSGQNSKNLRSRGKLSTFGTWIKENFMDAGVLEFGELITEETLKQFGRSTLSMKFHPQYGVWSFDLSRPQNIVFYRSSDKEIIIDRPTNEGEKEQ
ncbi:restriction endonuclease PLD domain-containing protein [Corynebacterium auriscanis]|uniref:restriction endonuclease PLD domain-containing protein n=1 Tax=Corynebacterium auriscanis TaxID=99807 RepID=UPI003CF6284B